MRASLLCLLLAASVARAAPQVEIKAQTRLALDKVHLLNDGLAEVAGELVDTLTGEGIPNQWVAVTIAGQTLTAATDNASSGETGPPDKAVVIIKRSASSRC